MKNDSYISRRNLLCRGASGVLGLSLPTLLSAAGRSSVGKAKNVLVILEQGGLSHIDTWDPKPETIAEHRSPHKPIATRVPGMRFTELLAETAKVADKLTVIRSMHHSKEGASGHPEGTKYLLSGCHPSSPLKMPDMGSVASNVLGKSNRSLPPYVMVPGNHEQADQTSVGFLPAGHSVFKTGGNDLSSPNWKVGPYPRGPRRIQPQLGPSRPDLYAGFLWNGPRQGRRRGALRNWPLGDDGFHRPGLCGSDP